MGISCGRTLPCNAFIIIAYQHICIYPVLIGTCSICVIALYYINSTILVVRSHNLQIDTTIIHDHVPVIGNTWVIGCIYRVLIYFIDKCTCSLAVCRLLVQIRELYPVACIGIDRTQISAVTVFRVVVSRSATLYYLGSGICGNVCKIVICLRLYGSISILTVAYRRACYICNAEEELVISHNLSSQSLLYHMGPDLSGCIIGVRVNRNRTCLMGTVPVYLRGHLTVRIICNYDF